MVSHIGIIDCSLGNTKSVHNALSYLGYEPSLVTPQQLSAPLLDNHYSGYVLPGVGAYSEGMARIRKYNIDSFLLQICRSNIPVLAICLG